MTPITEQLMRQYCEEAVKYGDEPLPTHIKPRHVTVILNPVAHKRKAEKLFKDYCEPLLHLSGIAVTILQTESEGHARNLVTNLNTQTDAIIVAGGDGTLSDVVTGIMRKYNVDLSLVRQCPIGILPLGQVNRVADSIFHGYEDHSHIREMAEATMAVVKGETKMIDVVEVQVLKQDPEKPMKPVYAVGALEWGAWRDANARVNKYWYWGSLRKYATYVFNGYKGDLNWDCDGVIRYTEPCDGCSRCYYEHQTTSNSTLERRWWHSFLPKRTSMPSVDYSKITNEKCGEVHEMPIAASEVHVTTSNAKGVKAPAVPAVKVELGPKSVSYATFVAEGWKRVHGNKTLVNHTVEAKDIELHPKKAEDISREKEEMFSIDNEEFELKPIKIRLLPRTVKIFCPSSGSSFNK
ncbi:acylglycerol kinase, mitochondrial isoform X2 [Cephus cinctus]|uniref:Acylglycerol kinase, mitochondrial n=1 Tax=Cephus cinctus TaxID=211228 RepID=A0AAJ7W442_CEPCN|nr:acylglycerol kinase, mitochondrial isoform X2 [Cephus cinctus]